METEIYALIQSLGFDVYLPTARNATWCYYTDGKRIGYAQWGHFDCSTSSVHMPNRQTGTGFKIGEDVTPATLRDAIACHAPNWASSADRAATRKYDDFAHFERAHYSRLVKLETQA